ncbi:Calponin homology (CH) domain containing protein [Aureococcus anophagefferens]|nr:Calponin homology (CH) domain containing protein [Aureococcus anophagefferens]
MWAASRFVERSLDETSARSAPRPRPSPSPRVRAALAGFLLVGGKKKWCVLDGDDPLDAALVVADDAEAVDDGARYSLSKVELERPKNKGKRVDVFRVKHGDEAFVVRDWVATLNARRADAVAAAEAAAAKAPSTPSPPPSPQKPGPEEVTLNLDDELGVVVREVDGGRLVVAAARGSQAQTLVRPGWEIVECDGAERLVPGTTYSRLHHKPRSKAVCIANIEQALGVVWRSGRVNNSLVASAAQIYDCCEKKPDRANVLLREIFDVYVFRELKRKGARVLAWYDDVLARANFGAALPEAAAKRPFAGLWDFFEDGAALGTVLKYFVGPKALAAGEEREGLSSYEVIKKDLDDIFELLRSLDVPVLWTADDWATFPDDEFVLAQLDAVYERFRDCQCAVPQDLEAVDLALHSESARARSLLGDDLGPSPPTSPASPRPAAPARDEIALPRVLEGNHDAHFFSDAFAHVERDGADFEGALHDDAYTRADGVPTTVKELAAAREHLADFGERGRRELKHKRAAADLRRKMLAIADLPSPERDAREEDVDREFELLDAAAGDLERRLRDEADELDKAEAGLVAGPAVRAQESGWVATGSKWETHNLLIRKAMNRVPDGDEPPAKEKTEAPKDREDVMWDFFRHRLRERQDAYFKKRDAEVQQSIRNEELRLFALEEERTLVALDVRAGAPLRDVDPFRAAVKAGGRLESPTRVFDALHREPPKARRETPPLPPAETFLHDARVLALVERNSERPFLVRVVSAVLDDGQLRELRAYAADDESGKPALAWSDEDSGDLVGFAILDEVASVAPGRDPRVFKLALKPMNPRAYHAALAALASAI